MSNTIIELSNRSATNSLDNGDFTTTFQPITINQGDVIQIKNSFIDTIQQNYDQIYIPSDTTVTMQCCFYEIIAGDTYHDLLVFGKWNNC